MKVVLCAVNAKYVHTNLAVRYIASYADVYAKKVTCEIVEDTVNAPDERILNKILAHKPDLVAFSVYIWNVTVVMALCEKIRTVCPKILIALGGPEVSYNPEKYLAFSFVDIVQCGEGERPMTELFDALAQHTQIPACLGICYKNGDEMILSDPYYEPDLNILKSPYTAEYIHAVSGRLAYFESSRGCPFSCAFCLSGACRGVRYFDMSYVKRAILALWQSGVRTVKFVDRTFNADRKRADEILSFILEHSGHMPKVCFHFEIAADILEDSTLALLAKAPVGLFQIEAGIQSFNMETLSAVTRKNVLEKVCRNVRTILQGGNIHTYVDLIAGLPYEGFESFRNSFNQAYALGAHMLQLGFLKLLYGSALREQCEAYGFVYENRAPYTVRSTRWLTMQEMARLEDVEDANEKIHNSHRFDLSLDYVLRVSKITPFDLFLGFGKRDSMPLDEYTDELFLYLSSRKNVDKGVLRDLMCQDRMRTNNTGKLPKSLKIADNRLGNIVRKLEKIPKRQNTIRAVCILYSENQVVYADYEKGNCAPYTLSFLDLSDFIE